MFRFKDRIVEKYAQGLLEFLEDPIKAYLFIIILRNPNITSHTIKQERQTDPWPHILRNIF